MAIVVRYYLFEKGGALELVPHRMIEALASGKASLREYANTKQRIAEVLLENESGKPPRILTTRGHDWLFDAGGRIAQGLENTFLWALDLLGTGSVPAIGTEIDIRPHLRRKKWSKRNRWGLRHDDIWRIPADIFATDGSAERLIREASCLPIVGLGEENEV
jgi:hypothetical protein